MASDSILLLGTWLWTFDEGTGRGCLPVSATLNRKRGEVQNDVFSHVAKEGPEEGSSQGFESENTGWRSADILGMHMRWMHMYIGR